MIATLPSVSLRACSANLWAILNGGFVTMLLRVQSDVRKSSIGAVKGVTAIQDVGGRRFQPCRQSRLRYGAEPAARVVDRAGELLDLEQPLAAPRRLDVPIIVVAVPDVAVAFARGLRHRHRFDRHKSLLCGRVVPAVAGFVVDLI
jgi:hypothetical protein